MANFNLDEVSSDRRKTIIDAAKELKENPKIAEDIQQIIDNQSICSFSILPDSALLWAHYADAHRGFCIGFKPKHLYERKNKGFDNIIPSHVEYTDSNPFTSVLHMIVTMIFSSIPKKKHLSTGALYHSIARSTVSTKSLAWSYEKEFRFIRIQGGNGCIKFAPLAVDEVILGCNISDKDRKKLLKVLDEPEWAHVRLREVKKSPTSFTL